MTDVTLPPSSPAAPDPNVIEGVGGVSTGPSISSSDPFAPAPMSSSSNETGSATNKPKPMTLEGMGLYTTPQIVPATDSSSQPPSAEDFPSISPEPTVEPKLTSESASESTSTSPASSPATDFPSIEQMQTSLQQSGTLMAGVEVANQAKPIDISPLAALQPERIKQVGEVGVQTPQITAPVIAPIPAFNPLPLETGKAPGTFAQTEVTVESPSLPFWLIFVVVLAGQCVIGVLQVVHTILIKFPLVQQLIATNQMAPEELHLYPLKALLIGGMAIVSVMLLGLIVIKAEARKNMFILVGATGLVMANIFVQNIFSPPEIISGNPLKIGQIISELQQNR